jgi:hypothetical protein
VDVEHDDVRAAQLDARERLAGRLGLLDLDVEDLEGRAQKRPQSRVVVYEQKLDLEPPGGGPRDLVVGGNGLTL